MSASSVLFDAPGPRARRLSLIVSIIAGVAIAAGLIWIVYALGAPRPGPGDTELPGAWDASRWDVFVDPLVWERIAYGVGQTLKAAGIAAALALAIGMLFSLLRSAESAWIRIPTTVVLEFLRGMPVLLMMLFILLVAGLSDPLWAVVAALALYNGALIGEALRAGLVALPRGQREAGLSLGMRPLMSKLQVEFPQAFRQMLPIIVAQLVVLLKDTSLGSIVGYDELLRTVYYNLGNFYGNRYLLSFFLVTLAVYLTMNLSLSAVARWLARRTDSASGGGRKRRKSLPPEDPDQAILAAEASADARVSATGGSAPGSRH